MNQAVTIHADNACSNANSAAHRGQPLTQSTATVALWSLAGVMSWTLLASAGADAGRVALYGVCMPAATWLCLLLYRYVSPEQDEALNGARRRRGAHRGSHGGSMPGGALRARRGRGSGAQRRPRSAPG